MSGLEPLAALGLACNILQLVELGRQTIGLIKDVHDEGQPNDIKATGEKAAVLKRIADQVKDESPPKDKNLDPCEHTLLRLADQCSTAANDLGKEVRAILGDVVQVRNPGKGSLRKFWDTAKVTSKFLLHKGNLKRLQGSLDEAERLLKSGLLADIW